MATCGDVERLLLIDVVADALVDTRIGTIAGTAPNVKTVLYRLLSGHLAAHNPSVKTNLIRWSIKGLGWLAAIT